MNLRNSSESVPSERRTRRRQWLVGCGVLLVLFSGAVWWIVRDEAPPDVSDLALPEPAPPPAGETLEDVITELFEARGTSDWEDVLIEVIDEAEIPYA